MPVVFILTIYKAGLDDDIHHRDLRSEIFSDIAERPEYIAVEIVKP